MDGGGDQFLSRAGLAEDEDRRGLRSNSNHRDFMQNSTKIAGRKRFHPLGDSAVKMLFWTKVVSP